MDGLQFILSLPKDYKHEGEFSGATCPKFNLVGPEEIDNLELAQMIARYTILTLPSTGWGHYDPTRQLWSLTTPKVKYVLVKYPYEFGHMGGHYGPDPKNVSKFQ